jgi:alkanesulfonate monooxygenase SsuD/methylene tetrahydromethanopterin reductase-like flavin-dependent oxidoreductase (luciferase family)
VLPQFGVSLQSGRDPSAFSRLAEAAGFDYLSCGEHLFFHGPTTNAFVSLSVAAGATESIGLVSAITLLPLYPPALAAKLATSLDVASGGRFVLGVGVGGEFPPEFEAAGVPVRERGARADEALEVVHRLMTEERVTIRGRFTTIDGLTLAPRPVQQPRVPFWIAGRRGAALRRVARVGDGWMPYLVTPEQVAAGRAAIDEHRREADGPAWAGRIAMLTFTTVDADGDRARRVAAEHVGRTYQQDFTALAPKFLVAGTPADCVRRLREYQQAGVDVFLFRLAGPRTESERMLRTIAEEVLPELRGTSVAPG